MTSNQEFGVISEESRDAAPTSGDEESMCSDVFPSNNDLAFNAISRNSSKASLDQTGDIFREVSAASLHEYFWPLNSVTDRYIIQEQLAAFLDVTSFRRKYPDLVRRPVAELEERNYLLKNEIFSEIQINMGLTALRAEDVYDLMMNDYPEKFEEFKKAIAEKNKQALAVKQMELHAVKSDSKRLEEWRKKAIRSAVEWNAELNRDRIRDRKCYLDMQTMIIQEPLKKQGRHYSTSFGSYPAALVPGQFQQFYKQYTKDDLYRLPVNRVLHADAYLPAKRSRSPDPITVKPEELLQNEIEEAKRKKEAMSSVKPKAALKHRVSADDTIHGEETGESCAFCQEDLLHGDRFVQCSKCGSCGHQHCLDMSDEIYDVAKTYNWMCMECKPCSICSKLDEEDKMLFCDRCDRGYHTFCVGLMELPSGRWVCPKYCVGGHRPRAMSTKTLFASVASDKASEAAVASVIATSLSVKPNVGVKPNISLDETVEAVALAVLSGAATSESPSSLEISSNAQSTVSLPVDQQLPKRRRSTNPTDVACIKCGNSSGMSRRKIPICKNCLATPTGTTNNEKKVEAVASEGNSFKM